MTWLITAKAKLYAWGAAIAAFLLLLLGYINRGAKLDRIKAQAAEQERDAYEAAMNAEARGHEKVEEAKEKAKTRSYFKK